MIPIRAGTFDYSLFESAKFEGDFNTITNIEVPENWDPSWKLCAVPGCEAATCLWAGPALYCYPHSVHHFGIDQMKVWYEATHDDITWLEFQLG